MHLRSLRVIMRPGIHDRPQLPTGRLTCTIRGCSGMGERRKDNVDTIAMIARVVAIVTTPSAVRRSKPIITAGTVVAKLEV